MAILEAGGTGFVDHNPVKALLARHDSVVIPSYGPLPKIAESVLTRLTETADPGNWRVCGVRLVADTVRRYTSSGSFHGTAVTVHRQPEASSAPFIFEVNPLDLVHVLEVAPRASWGL